MFLNKLQNLPDKTKRIILWSVVICLSVPLLFWWGSKAKERLGSFQGQNFIENLNFPELQAPPVDIPTDELIDKTEELEELIKDAQEEKSSTTTE